MYLGMSGYNFPKILYSCVWRSFFNFKNSVDPDEMQHYAAYHLGLHCLQKYLFYKGLFTILSGSKNEIYVLSPVTILNSSYHIPHIFVTIQKKS